MSSDRIHLRVGVSDLRRHPGERMGVQRDVDLGGIGVSSAAVPAGSTGRLDVVVESRSDGVTVTGTLTVPWTGPCRRCLEPTDGVAEVHLREVFSDDPVDADLLPIESDVIDLGPVLHDAAVLALPLAPLCRDDCAGPAPESFPVQRADGDERPVDPRWSALDELRFDPGTDAPLE
ncbi:MAG: DUF177 domain-containing protein [Actinobacteria bacterium]|nr:DUF177 domain-containing protein [Actinomycetota bacterium]